MAGEFYVLIGKSESEVVALADSSSLKIVPPIQEFSELRSNSRKGMGKIGRIGALDGGWVALAYKD